MEVIKKTFYDFNKDGRCPPNSLLLYHTFNFQVWVYINIISNLTKTRLIRKINTGTYVSVIRNNNNTSFGKNAFRFTLIFKFLLNWNHSEGGFYDLYYSPAPVGITMFWPYSHGVQFFIHSVVWMMNSCSPAMFCLSCHLMIIVNVCVIANGGLDYYKINAIVIFVLSQLCRLNAVSNKNAGNNKGLHLNVLLLLV